jgi:hypothetical protein
MFFSLIIIFHTILLWSSSDSTIDLPVDSNFVEKNTFIPKIVKIIIIKSHIFQLYKLKNDEEPEFESETSPELNDDNDEDALDTT